MSGLEFFQEWPNQNTIRWVRHRRLHWYIDFLNRPGLPSRYTIIIVLWIFNLAICVTVQCLNEMRTHRPYYLQLVLNISYFRPCSLLISVPQLRQLQLTFAVPLRLAESIFLKDCGDSSERKENHLNSFKNYGPFPEASFSQPRLRSESLSDAGDEACLRFQIYTTPGQLLETVNLLRSLACSRSW